MRRYLENAIDVLTYLTFYGEVISPQLWSLFPALYRSFDKWAYDYIGNMIAPIDNYIGRDVPGFLSGVASPEASSCVLAYTESEQAESDHA